MENFLKIFLKFFGIPYTWYRPLGPKKSIIFKKSKKFRKNFLYTVYLVRTPKPKKFRKNYKIFRKNYIIWPTISRRADKKKTVESNIKFKIYLQ